MKARVKATGEIGIVSQIDVLLKDDFVSFNSNNVEILQNYADATIEPDYWTRLEHQYIGMAMQGLVTRGKVLGSSVQEIARDIAEISCEVATALVKKLKESKV